VLASPPVDPWSLLVCAFGVAVFLEGLPYFIAPASVRRFLAHMSQTSDTTLRTVGLALMVVGLLLAYLALP